MVQDNDGKALIAPAGKRMSGIFLALREMPVRKIHLVVSPKHTGLAEKARKDLQKIGYPTTLWSIQGDVWEETFRIMSEIAHQEKNAVIHVGTGDYDVQCAATSAAFVNGVYAIDGNDKMIMALPVLRFNYYKEITPKRLSILSALTEQEFTSIDALAARCKMSLPLISYHLHGNYKTEGLVAMGLVTIGKRNTSEAVAITPMARLLLKGYVGTATENSVQKRRSKKIIT